MVTQANVVPTEYFTATPTSGTAPLQVAFDVSTSVGNGATISTYQWDFDNDGTTDDTGAQVSHTHPTAGNYTAKLTVTNANSLTCLFGKRAFCFRGS